MAMTATNPTDHDAGNANRQPCSPARKPEEAGPKGNYITPRKTGTDDAGAVSESGADALPGGYRIRAGYDRAQL